MILKVIILSFLISSSSLLSVGEQLTLSDLHKQWGTNIGWKLPVSNACLNWSGIKCSSDSVIIMFVRNFKFFIVKFYFRKLDGKDLSGTLPPSIGNLINLQTLYQVLLHFISK